MTSRANSRKNMVKTVLPKTLLGRSLLILILPVFLIQVVSTFVFFDRHWEKMTSRLANAIAGEVVLLAEFIENNPTPAERQKVIRLFEENLSMKAEFRENQKLEQKEEGVGVGWAYLIGTKLNEELKLKTDRPFRLDVHFEEKQLDLIMQLDNGTLSFEMPQRRLFSSTTYIFLLWIYSVSILLLIIAVLFMRNQVRPIRRLAIAAERFGKGRDVENFKVEGAREVRQAGQAFIDMSTRIKRQVTQRTAMLAGVSHDLRTPLTRMKLQIELLGDSPDVEALKGDIEEMEKMIDGYLTFVRGEGNEVPTSTGIGQLIENVVTSAKREGNEITLKTEGLENVFITLRPMALKRCLTNLIGNAAKYSSKVWVTAEKNEPKKLLITIEDNGPGIPEDHYDDVFKPFFRVDSSRNTDTGGVGLGLPIAMDIIHAHGGIIWLEQSQHGGLAVKIRLPA